MRIYITGICFASVLASCGGGSDDQGQAGGTPGNPASYTELFATTAKSPSNLSVFAVTSDGLGTENSAGIIDQNANTIDFLSFDGSTVGNFVVLSGGGVTTLTSNGNSFSATFTVRPASGNSRTGVLGVPTFISELPSTASYTGTSAVQINDGSAVFELTGNSSAEIDFLQSSAEVTLSDLSGTRSTGVSAPTNVTNVANIMLNNIGVSGSSLSGGTATVTSSQLSSSLTSSPTVSLDGGVFGPAADEVGGSLVVDDTASGSLLLQGTFLGD